MVPSQTPAFCDAVLSPAEHCRLRDLETVIERGLETFLQVGQALEEIRISRLYRQTYHSFETYVRDRWAISISRANQLILSVNAARNLIESGVIEKEEAALKPETLFRPLSKVAPELQTLSWELAKRIEQEPDTIW